jgi:hypothetical protein
MIAVFGVVGAAAARAGTSQRVYGKYFEKSQGVTSHSVPLMRLVTSVFQQFAVAFDFADESQHLVAK